MTLSDAASADTPATELTKVPADITADDITNAARPEDKPVARIRPMARNDVTAGVVVPPPRPLEDPSGGYVNVAAILEPEECDNNSESEYQNIEPAVLRAKHKEPHENMRSKAKKVPVPAVRRSVGDLLVSENL